MRRVIKFSRPADGLEYRFRLASLAFLEDVPSMDFNRSRISDELNGCFEKFFNRFALK